MGTKSNTGFNTGVYDIYNTYRPAYSNLYTVNIYSASDEESKIKDLSTYITYHAKNVTLNGESLQLRRNDVTKKFQFDANDPYKLADTLSITWRENNLWQVRKYHEEWLSLFYDKDTDQFKSKETDAERDQLYRTFDIVLPMVDLGENESRSMMNYNVVRCYNVIPQGIDNISLGWSSTATIVEHQINYYVEKWQWVAINSEGGVY